MSGSSVGGSASNGAVAFGIALLFATGAGGFYLLTEVARPGARSTVPAYQPAGAPDEDAPTGAPAVPVAPDGANAADADPAPDEFAEWPDFFPVPTMIPSALPGR
jgi:hypothetical protein